MDEILTRRSIREYADEAVTDEMVKKMVHAGMSACVPKGNTFTHDEIAMRIS